tara:strand:- start:29 stop:424 length:396 start_codon:yes stop_codon:yes gene_type:complete
MDYKYNEIKDYFNDYLKENSSFLNEVINNGDTYDLHHHAFNSDYYIIGTYKATQWLGDEVFNIINFIKEYENDNFGEVNTDFSSSESVVNMYVYIIGETIVNEYLENDLYIQAKIEIQDSVNDAKQLINNL